MGHHVSAEKFAPRREAAPTESGEPLARSSGMKDCREILYLGKFATSSGEELGRLVLVRVPAAAPGDEPSEYVIAERHGGKDAMGLERWLEVDQEEERALLVAALLERTAK